MLVCSHCEEDLTIRNQTVIACDCEDSVKQSFLDKARYTTWRQDRDQKLQQEREQRQKDRRNRVALSKKR